MKHTPGKWLIAESDSRFIYALNEYGYNRFWCRVDGGKIARTTITPDDELIANARLMAAAPELLEALLDASHMIYGDYYYDHPTAVKVRNAIEKATGE